MRLPTSMVFVAGILAAFVSVSCAAMIARAPVVRRLGGQFALMYPEARSVALAASVPSP